MLSARHISFIREMMASKLSQVPKGNVFGTNLADTYVGFAFVGGQAK
jgi:hypothetical protein